MNLGAGYLWGLLAGQITVMLAAAVGTFFATLLLRRCAAFVEPKIRSNDQVCVHCTASTSIVRRWCAAAVRAAIDQRRITDSTMAWCACRRRRFLL